MVEKQNGGFKSQVQYLWFRIIILLNDSLYYISSAYFFFFKDVPVRLGGGNHPYEGRVEIFHDGAWGTVCGVYWTKIDATVVCRQLGYFFASGVTMAARKFGEGSGPIFLHNVACTGSETDLFECDHDEIGEHLCRHSHDAGVMCALAPPGKI